MIWDMKTNACLGVLDHRIDWGPVTQASWLPVNTDVHKVLSGTARGHLRIWSQTSANVCHDLPSDGKWLTVC